jgi:SET domain-containing protein
MYFIAAKTIQAGAELTIDYGKDYWAERSGFGTMAPQEQTVKSGEAVVKGEALKNEGMGLQQNANDITDANRAKQFGQPNSSMNPAVSGVAILGPGQS